MNSDIKLIIGLGNPGRKYENTYHNVGHMAADYLAGEKTIKSDSYMNKSGVSVAKALEKYGVEAEDLLIIHDDSDIEIGKYKMDFGRGSGGHHGVESVQQHIKTNEFWRLRIGIRPPEKEGAIRLKAVDFVLKKISPSDKKILEGVFSKISEELR